MRKRHLAAAAVLSVSIAVVSQLPASAAGAQPGTLMHEVITDQESGFAVPAGSTGLAGGSITGLPDGSSQLVAVTGQGVLKHNIRHANGTWQGWNAIAQPGVTVANASIAGMPNGSSQLVEVTSTGVLKHDIRNANGSWQSGGWGTPAGSTGIAQASISALPNGSSEILAITSAGSLELNTRTANATWQGWTAITQTGVKIVSADVAGMPNGSSQFIEVTSTGAVKFNLRNANGTWQATGWTPPYVSIGTGAPQDIVQASIAALPNGNSAVAVSTTEASFPAFVERNPNGTWWSAWTQLYQHATYTEPADVSLAGMPNGDIQVIEIAQPE